MGCRSALSSGHRLAARESPGQSSGGLRRKASAGKETGEPHLSASALETLHPSALWTTLVPSLPDPL